MSSSGKSIKPQIVGQKRKALHKPEKTYDELLAAVISSGAIRRLGFRAGLKRSTKPRLAIYCRQMAREYLQEVMRKSVVHARACGRITVDTVDMAKTLKRMGVRIIGLGYSGSSGLTSYNGDYLAQCRARRGGNGGVGLKQQPSSAASASTVD